jgi:thiol-disulfide isomerase/thioredoxin
MSVVLTLIAAMTLTTAEERGHQILQKMLAAIRDVKTVEVRIEGENLLDRTVTKGHILASNSSIHYWTKFESSSGLTEYAVLKGKQLRYTDSDGQRKDRELPIPRIVMNNACSLGLDINDLFWDANIVRELSPSNSFYVHQEEIDGAICDLVGFVRTRNDGEQITTIRYFWIDRSSGLPRAYQRHGFVRGRSSAGTKWVIKETNLNSEIREELFEQIPEKVLRGPEPVQNRVERAWKSGDAIPDMLLESMELKSIKLKDQVKGRTLVTFWAPWCGPCKAEIGALYEIAEVKAGQIKVIAIGVGDSKQNIRRYALEKPLPIVFAIDPDCERSSSVLNSAFGVTAIPRSFLFNEYGQLIREWVGFESKEALQKKLVNGTDN